MWIAILAIAAIVGFGVYHNKHQPIPETKTRYSKALSQAKPKDSKGKVLALKVVPVKSKAKKIMRLDGVEIVNLSTKAHPQNPVSDYYQISQNSEQAIPKAQASDAIDLKLSDIDTEFIDGSLEPSTLISQTTKRK